MPIGEYKGPIRRKERCLIVATVNQEILFIFKEKERWKLKIDYSILSFYFGEMKLNAGDSKSVSVLIVFGHTTESMVFYDVRVAREEV